MINSSNPALAPRVFEKWAAEPASTAMTVQGTVYKSLALVGLVTASFVWIWAKVRMEGVEVAAPFMIGGFIGGLVLALVTCFAAKASPITAPLYALCKGLALGGLSALVEIKFPGIVFQAVALTLGIFLSMLLLYTSRTIRATPAFTKGIMIATLGVMAVYLISFLMRMFGGVPIPYIHDGGAIGIGFSLVVIVLAALNFIIDFDLVEQGAASGAPKFMEWYAGFGLLVTLLWLYIEVLKLLIKLRGRD
jgi:uncharacterized YccA/Bax inhibitor family protein